MDPLSVTASIVALLGATQKVIKVLQDVKDAPEERQKCLVEALFAVNLLWQLKDRLDRASAEDAWFKGLRSLAVDDEDGPISHYKSAIEELQSRLKPDGGTQHRLKEFRHTVSWRLRKSDVDNILRRMERFKTSIQLVLDDDHFVLSESIKQDTSKLVASQESAARSKQRSDVLDWVSQNANDDDAKQKDYEKAATRGTGSWLFDTDDFKDFESGNHRTLFCQGIPGSGKTILSSLAVRHLQEKYAVAVLYFNYKSQDNQEMTRILLSIIKQLLMPLDPLPESILRFYEKMRASKPGGGPEQLSDLTNVKEIFSTLIVKQPKTFIILDALDEMSYSGFVREELLAELREAQEKACLQVMATSRYDLAVEAEFGNCPRIEISAREEDMRRYLEEKMGKTIAQPVRRKLHLEIQRSIIDAAKGMFLLARLHLESLRDKRTVFQMTSALQSLPTGAGAIQKTYDAAIERIDRQEHADRNFARQVIAWIVCARRPLSPEELQYAVAITPERFEDPSDNIREVKETISVCGGLVVIDSETDVVRLVHYTTQEFFSVQKLDEWAPKARLYIAKACLTYLLVPLSDKSLWPSKIIGRIMYYWYFRPDSRERRLRRIPLLSYVASFWNDHIRDFQQDIKELGMEFLRTKKALIFSTVSIRHMEMTANGTWYRHKLLLDPLTVAARAGLCFLVKGLLDQDFSKSRKTACSKALQQLLLWNYNPPQYEETGRAVRLLISQEPDFNVWYKPPVMSVSHDSQEQKFLVRNWEEKAPLICMAVPYETALAACLEHPSAGSGLKLSHETLLKKILRSGPAASLRLLLGQLDKIPIHVDHDKAISFILANRERNHGDELLAIILKRPNAKLCQENIPENILIERLSSYDPSVLRPILTIVPDILNCKFGHNMTFLALAVESGNREMLQWLLQQSNIDADLKAGRHKKTPLSLAAGRGEVEMAKLLLTKPHVDVNARDIAGHTPLYHAIYHGRTAVVELLQNHGTLDVDTNREMYLAKRANMKLFKSFLLCSTPEHEISRALLAVVSGGDHEDERAAITSILLDHPLLNINATDEYGRTALSLAAKSNLASIVTLLLSHPKIELRKKDNQGCTNLMSAVDGGAGPEVTGLLLELGGEIQTINHQDKKGKTALSRVFMDKWVVFSFRIIDSNNKLDSLELLLQQPDLQLNLKDNSGCTALSYAVVSDFPEREIMLQKLLERQDLDVNVTDHEGRTPLVRAVCATREMLVPGQYAFVGSLLNHPSIDVDVRDIHGKTALDYAQEYGFSFIMGALQYGPHDSNWPFDSFQW